MHQFQEDMDYISGWCRSTRRLDGCTAIVTGANGGIGKETALDLYKRGAKVIMACRNMEKAEKAKHDIIDEAQDSTGTIVTEKLDLCSLASVRDFCRRVLESDKRLQILVNNAGVMCCPEAVTEDGFETHIGSNHFGHALLTLLLLPRLIENGPSRIVFVSSDAHYFYKMDLDDINCRKTQYRPLEAYSKSKIANLMFAKALANKLKENNINNVTTYSLHPGVVYTNIDRYFPWLISRLYRWNLLKWIWKSARCGAQTSIFCAVDETCGDQSGLYYADCAPCPPSSYCQNDENATKLWDLTIQILALNSDDLFDHTSKCF